MNRMIACVTGLLLCTNLAVAKSPKAIPDLAQHYTAQVEHIVAGATTEERGKAITRQLDQLGIKYSLEPFLAKGMQGNNIVAELPGKGTKQLLIGAHYDRVEKGQGAVDNASSSASVLELLTKLKADPLRNYRVTAVFFDLEEKGLLGSNAYVEAHADALPDLAINMDVFGYGNTLWVMAPAEDSAAAAAVREVTAKAEFPAIIGREYPPSDHLSFIKADVPTISLSLLDGEEIQSIVRMFQGEELKAPPRVFAVIHTDGDTMAQIDGAAVAKALPVVEAAIRRMDDDAR